VIRREADFSCDIPIGAIALIADPFCLQLGFPLDMSEILAASKGSPKRGGRQKGTRNKATLAFEREASEQLGHRLLI
jgi:hypothetical protein